MNRKGLITLIVFLFVIPLTVISASILFKEKYYSFISVLVVIFSIIPAFYAFEKKDNSAKELSVIAVMVAISVIGRFVFAFLPGFKPVTAITVITAIYLGREAGFIVGSLSAFVSNFYFGQGPWTPFQMFAWGVIGFVAGITSVYLKKSKLLLCLFGVISGVAFSLTMDIWTTVWADGVFNVKRYLALVLTAMPLTVEYAVSNVVFLLLLSKPIGEKLFRIKNKYGLFKTCNKRV